MNLTAGFPARSIRFPRPPQPPCNTQIPPITRRGLAASILTAPGLTVGDTASGGAPSVSATAGLHSPMGNGCGIPLLAGLGTGSNPGAGPRIITVVGSLTPAAVVGFTRRLCSTESIQA